MKKIRNATSFNRKHFETDWKENKRFVIEKSVACDILNTQEDVVPSTLVRSTTKQIKESEYNAVVAGSIHYKK